MTQQSIEAILADLSSLAANEQADPTNRQSANIWKETLLSTYVKLQNRDWSVVFIGKPGVGKSSVINMLAKLQIGTERPSNKSDLIKQTVLSIGAGRTTTCEVRIVSRSSGFDAYQLSMTPYSEDEIRRELALYARWEWQRYANQNKDSSSPLAELADKFSQEQQRGLRNFCDLAEYSETRTINGQSRRVTVKPIEQHLQAFLVKGDQTLTGFAAFEAALLERAKLGNRTQVEWHWPNEAASLAAIKQQFARLNLCLEPNASLPKTITLSLPATILPDADISQLSLVDTRGLDNPVASRADINEWLDQDYVIPVVCSGFTDAPDARARDVLSSMENDARQQAHLADTILLLLDQGDAEYVTNAENDRERGKEIKIGECQDVLTNEKLQQIPILSMDVLQDDCLALLEQIQIRITANQKRTEDELGIQVVEATAFLQSWQDQQQNALKAIFDEKLQQMLVSKLPIGIPLQAPLQGFLAVIRDAHPASIVYASCLRNGEYANLNAYTAIHKYAARLATNWIGPLFFAAQWLLGELRNSGQFDLIKAHQVMRLRQVQNAPLDFAIDYAGRIKQQIKHLLQDDEGKKVWQACADEWGKGDGFKLRVMRHLEDWAKLQMHLDAHLTHNLYEAFPLLADAKPKQQVPRVALQVRNLRALREVFWQPLPLSLLIGANGSGKTTLILVFKLLRRAWERGLPEAIVQVLGGPHQLRSKGLAEHEMVEIGLDFGDLQWRLSMLIQGAGQNMVQTRESLHQGSNAIFTRDFNGQFLWRGQLLEAAHSLGLRAIIDKGESSHDIRQLARLFQSISIHHDPDLRGLRLQGSNHTDDRNLQTHGENTFALLRRWYQDKQERYRYDFVLHGLQAAFPNLVSDFDFDVAGNTVFVRIYRPGLEEPIPIMVEANGILQMLVVLCALAATNKGGIVAFDEPENCLHPHALMALMRFARRWSKSQQIIVIFTTHSVVLLDAMETDAEAVFVMKTKPETQAPEPQTKPVALNHLVNQDWLQGYKFGELFEQGEIGSNGDA